jgi:hypothetical protein
MNSQKFKSLPFGVFYKENPTSSQIKDLQKSNVVFLFLDYSNYDKKYFSLFDPVIYFNSGAFEAWRVPKIVYPKNVIGRAMDGWEGEYWLDISNDVVFKTLTSYIDNCMIKITKDNPNWIPKIDLDNCDLWNQNTGFKIEKSHQIKYLNSIRDWFSSKWKGQVCIRNCSEIVHQLKFDAVLSEQALSDKFIDDYKKVIQPIFDIEYYGNMLSALFGKKTCLSYQKKNNNVKFIGANKNLTSNFFNV